MHKSCGHCRQGIFTGVLQTFTEPLAIASHRIFNQRRFVSMKPIKTKDKTVLRSLGLGGYFGGGAEGMVDVKDGKIVRVRPMRYGWKYKKEDVRQWKMSRNGKTIEPTWKSLPGPFSLAYKKRVYSPNR